MKQTKDLLSKGYVTSRGKLHGVSAFADGNAYALGRPSVAIFADGSSKGQWEGTGYSGPYDPTYDPAEALEDAAGDLSDAADKFEETFDWIEVRLEELDEVLGLLSAQLENAVSAASKNDTIDKIIDLNKQKYANSLAGADYYEAYANKYWNQIPGEYKEWAKNGAIAITDFVGEANEAVVEAIEKYREYAQKAADLAQQAEEIITEIRDLAIQRIDNAYEAGSVRATVEDSQTEKLQNAVDLDEERGLVTSDAYYLAMMENSNKKIEYLTEARNAMQEELNEAVRNGEIIKGSNEWYEMIDKMYQIDAEIAEATIELEEFQNAINDIYWGNFENLTNQIEYLKNQTQSLIDLMENSGDLVAEPVKRKYEGGTVEYWTADDVDWTDEGLASLGLYAQQMEIAEFEARQYAEAIEDLKKQYAEGKYSESEYLEKLDELTSAQYDAIDSYYEAQDAIVELNEARIDSIKEGIEKEIEAYEELIEKKKEELQSEKDLYDFQKSAMEQQKDIAEIERRLAALANDNSMSAIAERKRLEAELAEAKAAQEELYYERSIEDQQEALDKELEDFNNQKDAEIEKWEEYLENVELVVAESLGVIQANASGIYDTLNAKAQEYDLTLSDSIMSPWQDGALAVSDYQNSFDTAMSSTMDQLEALKAKWQEVIDKMAEAGNANVANINQENEDYTAATKQENTKPSSSNNNQSNQTQSEAPSLAYGSSITVKKSATHFSAKSGNAKMASFVPGGKYTVYQVSGNEVLIGRNGEYTGWIKKTDIEGFAKGTKGVKKDQLAWIDENGLEELVLHAGPDGRLQYLTKGTSVLNSTLTDRLMDLAMNPQDMLDRNRPSINVHPEIHNTEINIDITYGDMISIGEYNGNNLEGLEKMVAKQFEKHTKDLNSAIRRFAR